MSIIKYQFLQRFLSFISDNHLFDPSAHLLLAVSGGVDSVTLCELCHRAGFHFAIAHCNFHLRPGDCDRDELFVRQLAASYGVPCHVAQFDTQTFSSQHHLSIEEAARVLRYDFFNQLIDAHGYDRLLTAHHRDDSAETFFLNLLRGTGIAGLHGIRPSSPLPVAESAHGSQLATHRLVRPMLPFGREEIERFAAENNLQHVEDVTNASLAYRRNQIRHQLIPLLRTMSPTFDQAISQTIEHLSDAEHIFRQAVNEKRKELFVERPDGIVVVSCSQLSSLEPLRTWTFELFRPFGFNAATIDSLLESLGKESGRRFSSSTHLLVVNRDELHLAPIFHVGSLLPLSLDFVTIEAHELPSLVVSSEKALFDADRVAFPLHQRHWQPSDRFYPFGMKGSRLLSDFFSDRKLSLLEKQSQWLLCDANDQILWVVGLRADGRYAVTPATRHILIVSLLSSEE